MFGKGSKFYSIFKNKCPKCQEGTFFINQNPFNLKDTLKIHENCSNCGLKYMIEPSFFYGAMYVSYGLTVGVSILLFLICFYFNFDLLTIFFIIFGALIALTPFTLRLSRLIYINLFVHYQKDDINQIEQ